MNESVFVRGDCACKLQAMRELLLLVLLTALPEAAALDLAIVGAGPVGTSAALRAAINTPVQGSAADLVNLAMMRLHESPALAQLGFRLLLQIHDEVILEGPSENADAALAELVKLMERPFDHVGLDPLHVDLVVDAAVAGNWYEAK